MITKFFVQVEAVRWNPDDVSSLTAIMAWLAADGVPHGVIGAGENMALTVSRGDRGGDVLTLGRGEWLVRDPAKWYTAIPDDIFKEYGFMPASGYVVLGRGDDGELLNNWDHAIHPTLREGARSYRDGDRAGLNVTLAAMVEVEA